jgi:hypothetical protein
MTSTRRESDFTRTRATRTPPSRDPLGKAALFSGDASVSPISPDADGPGRGATHLFSQPGPRSGTLLVDCSACGRRTRVTYAEFALMHLPMWLWVPLLTRSHRHWLRCPACRRFTWLRARWLE